MASHRNYNKPLLDFYDTMLTASDSPQNMAVTRVRSSSRRSNRQHTPYNFTADRGDLNSDDERMDESSRSGVGSPYYINPTVGNRSSQFNGNQGSGAAGPTTRQVWNKPVTGDRCKQWNGNADIDGLKLFFK